MAAETEARAKLVEEHVLAEVEHDVERIMRTWGRVTLVRRCAWNEQSYGRDEVREHYEELLTSFRDLAIDVKARHVTDDAVIVEVVVSGTHLGPWRDLPPLERMMESRVCAVYTLTSRGCWS